MATRPEFGPKVSEVSARALTIPTDAPESDGTFAWTGTTVVIVHVRAGGREGLGYTYASAAAAEVVRETLAQAVAGRDALDVAGAWEAMWRQVRNLGSRGVCACAISAVDAALWDLKARLLDLPLCRLLGRRRDQVPVYGSGGFTSYEDRRLREQLSGWAEAGCRWVKMKVGREPTKDLERVKAARQAIGGRAELFVDANGAFRPKEALYYAERFASFGVRWFEEPTSSDDLAGLRAVREQGPAGMEVAAGEYGFDPFYFRRMLEAEAVDVIQADVTRCLGVTGFLKAAELAAAHNRPLSGHCAPALHLHVACAAPGLRHLEWFHDHVRIESLLFDGAPRLRDGLIAPDLSRPGLGLELKAQDAQRYAA
jgi:L-alanine-DL-glutamate epimerase-like enolase superfamily enzyme